MKTIKINKNTNKVTVAKTFIYDEIVTSGDGLYITTDINNALEVSVGSMLHFEKYASGSTGDLMKVCERDVKVLNVTDDENHKRHIYFEYPYITPLTVSSFLIVEDGSDVKYKFSFSTTHNMVPLSATTENPEFVPTDFETYFGKTQKVYVIYVVRGANKMRFEGIELCYPNTIERGRNITEGRSECSMESQTMFNYDSMDKLSILAGESGLTEGVPFIPSIGDQVIFSTNPYFWTNNDAYGTISFFENVLLTKYTDFMGVNVVLEEDYDAKRMFQEHQVNDLFIEKVKNSVVPGFIDLEKVKFAPAFKTIAVKPSVFLATGMTFNMHFRTRVMSKENKYKFEDTWHLDNTIDTWNGNTSTPVKRDNIYDDPDFVNSSNLVGFLGFTDDDIYNQKNRVKQSFLRLSFYDSTNPLEQNLLYYSTIFLDSDELFGKFVKRKSWLQENNSSRSGEEVPVVWSFKQNKKNEASPVTSQLVVNDEYDTSRSGEGFNLYLFKQDAPIENEWKPIYMKVEFNHAGYGRTVPLIHWKTINGKPVKLTVSNYFENLYIPIEVGLTDKGYVYSFEADQNGIVWEDDRLVFNLFEPKIENEGEQFPDTDTIEVNVTGSFEQS